ncbi:amidohydrolase family protein [Treponema parvum]|uniref:Amidohydrolase family protein n=1 Tax=Treponema parvum TaxID=138851 RepID=A0A975IEL5_9SPIR|nr:amidohydrolase family protein [Treponema parvum]QTQ14175.1 amidohydrolase family protein [Treponema parvum]
MIFTGWMYGTDTLVKLEIKDGVFISVEKAEPENSVTYPNIAPVLFDTQINGFSGVDFNITDELTEEAYRKSLYALLKEGCGLFCPTVITASPEQILKRCKEIASFLQRAPLARKMTHGIHIEGPFISPKDGACGAHDKRYIRAPDFDMFKSWYDAAEGKISAVTVSPEWGEEAYSFISKVSALGVVVSVGHTMASEEQVAEAVASGASLVTHFGNGVPVTVPRHPNFLWEELSNEGLTLSCIADGFHLPESVLKTVFAIKRRRSFIISDSTQFGGLEPGTYETPIGGNVLLEPNGRLCMTSDPRLLAGSAQSILHGVEHLFKSGICSLKDAWMKGSEIPAAFYRCERKVKIARGCRASFVCFEKEEKKGLTVSCVYLDGEKVL